MKKYITTCDQYLPLLKYNAYFFNKYWNSDEEVTVLGYAKPDFDLPPNFTFYSFGHQSDYSIYWSNAVRIFFESVKDPYFLIFADDTFLIKPVDLERLDRIERLFIDNRIQKAFLDVATKKFVGKTVSDGIIEIAQGQYPKYRNGLPGSIWQRDHFLKYLKPNLTIWQFETTNFKMAAREMATVVIASETFLTLNVINKGRFNHKNVAERQALGLLKDEDLEIIRKNYSGFEADVILK